MSPIHQSLLAEHVVWRSRKSLRGLIALSAGLLFGCGLHIAGMTQPGKVQGFLDVAGAWDPSLALVMASALVVAALGFTIGRQRQETWLGETIPPLPVKPVDRRLIAGSVLFGLGWGISGICPGPALFNLFAGNFEVIWFLFGMLAGLKAAR